MDSRRDELASRFFRHLIVRECAKDLLEVLERRVVAPGPGRGRRAAAFFLGMLLCWFLYAPIHELLHAAGCVLAGGEVSEVKISPKYGAALYAKVFPFVKAAESGYAGRLTKFDHRNSDLVYLITDYFPFLLSVLTGYPLLMLADRARSASLAGAGVTLIYVPLMQVPNDYYEMASILLTRLASAPAAMRSDDAFWLIQESFLPAKPGAAAGGAMAAWIAAGLVLAVILALLTWKASKAWGLWVLGGRREP